MAILIKQILIQETLRREREKLKKNITYLIFIKQFENRKLIENHRIIARDDMIIYVFNDKIL